MQRMARNSSARNAKETARKHQRSGPAKNRLANPVTIMPSSSSIARETNGQLLTKPFSVDVPRAPIISIRIGVVKDHSTK